MKRMSNTAMDVKLISLLECDKYSAAEIGLKAWRLMEIAKQGITVPPALIIPATQVKKFWSGDDVNVSTTVSKFIWETCCQTFDTNKLIVRSSGLEDGERFSFAGQFESVPGVTDSNSLQIALVKCISSSRSEEVKRYQKVTDDRSVGADNFAVFIMPQSDCIISGIMFSSVNIDNGSANCTVLQITQGNNFALTAGSSTGDIVYLNHNSGKLIYLIKDKSTAIDYSPEHLLALHKLATQLEKLAGYTADIEWGILPDGRLETYQLRPITGQVKGSTADLRLRVILQTVAMAQKSRQNLRERGVNLSSNNVWSNQNIAELLPGQPSRAAFGLFTYIFADGHGAISQGRNAMGYEVGEELKDGFFQLIGGRPRCSITHDALTYRIKGIPIDDYVEGFVNQYLRMIADNTQLANYPEVVLYEQNPTLDHLIELFGPEKGAQYYECYMKFFSGIRKFEEEIMVEFKEQFEPAFQSYIDSSRKKLTRLGDLTMIELVKESQLFMDHLRDVSCVMFVKIARLGFFAYARLRRQLEEMYDEVEGRHKLDQIIAGLEGDASLMLNIRLAALCKGEIQLDDLIAKFGHLGPNELEIANPRYRNKPKILLELAKNMVGNPTEELKKRSAEADRITKQVLTRCQASDRESLEIDLKMSRRYLAIREKAKYYFLMEYDLFRQCLVQMAKLLEVQEEFIFELDPRELSILVEDSQAAIELMTDRNLERQALGQIYIPQVIIEHDMQQIDHEEYDPEAKVMMGIGITPIIMTGPVVIVNDPHDAEAMDKLTPGCVLISKTTDPTWAPIIAAVGNNGALVTEIGGPLAHGAIVARDIGIACVQNVPGVTKRFITGDIVQVDGKNGTVMLIEESK